MRQTQATQSTPLTTRSWVAPGDRLFIVAYESADGRPYALAISDHAVATKLARRFAGEVIDTRVDNHAALSPRWQANSDAR